jgi:hypothetical protein
MFEINTRKCISCELHKGFQSFDKGKNVCKMCVAQFARISKIKKIRDRRKK